MNFANDRRNVFGEAISIGLKSGDGAITHKVQLRIAEHHATGLCGLQRVFRALCDHLSFVLRYIREDVNGQFVGVRIVDRDERLSP